MTTDQPAPATTAAERINLKIAALSDWRGPALARLREAILAADPAIVEEVKWVKPSNPAGVPVWSCGGIVCTGEVYKDKLKLTFAHGAALPDPVWLFNASLEGNQRRAIDVGQGAELPADALQALVRAAVAFNQAASRRKKTK